METALKPVVFRQGKLVRLRPPEERDLPLFVRWINDPEVSRFLASNTPYSMIAERAWVDGLSTKRDDFVLVIETLDGDVPIGTIGLHGVSLLHGTATTGTLIGEKEYWGKGYGTEAKMLLLQFAFHTLNLRRISSLVISYNKRSLAYAKKCGYVYEGRRKKFIFRDGKYWDDVQLVVWREAWEPLWKEYKKGMKK